MDVRQLTYAVAVAEHGSFTAAAESLRITQPSLSQGIHALEAELGIRLFDRRSRPVRPTAAGEALLEPARRALRELDNARAAVDDVRGVRAGNLDLVALPTLSIDPVAPLIGRFRRAHPAVAVRLREPEDAAAVATMVRAGTCELGVCDPPTTPPGEPSDRLVTHELAAQSYSVVLPPRMHVAGGGGIITTEELADLPLVTTPPGTSTRAALDETLARVGRQPQVVVETDLRESVVPLVLAGAGAAFVADGLAASARRRGARTLGLDRPAVRRVAVIHRADSLSPAAAAFLALALPDEALPKPTRPRPRRR
jgi:DNA-binding transcriptional LysR family regulator